MTRFRVWAPRPREVDLVVDGRTVHTQRQAGGWREAEVDCGPGARYGYSLDGADPIPDPRSPFQPDGVHGLSQAVDHRQFPWTDQAWRGFRLETAVIYELHVGTFSAEGTFDGAAAHLEELAELGVNVVELMPVAAFPGVHGWGYDGVSLFAPHAPYGGPEALNRLVNSAHQRGLAVVLDVVYNHLGPDGNYLSRFGPYFNSAHRTPWGDAVNLDGPDSSEVRNFFLDNARQWIVDYHFDGLRIDAIHALVDNSPRHFLAELTAHVHRLAAETGRAGWVIAESDLNDSRVVQPESAGGLGCDAQWSDDLHHALHALLTGERTGYYADYQGVAAVAAALSNAFVMVGQYSAFRGGPHGAPRGDVPLSHFLAYVQTHDQVGNRAQGDRLGALVGARLQAVAAGLVLTSSGLPMIFQGEEWMASSPFQYFTDHQDPALARAVSRGRIAEFASFGWAPSQVPDPQAESTFRNSKLPWHERSREPHREMLDWYRALLRLRAQLPLSDAPPKVEFDEQQRWIRVTRPGAVICANLGSAPSREVLGHGGSPLLAMPGALIQTPQGPALAPASLVVSG